MQNAQQMAQTHQLSSTQRMAEAVLGTGLRDFLNEAYAKGLSYEGIAREMHDRTDGAVSVSYTTVKRWLADFNLLKEAS